MNRSEHLLTCIAEEGSEITKDATKALRFGIHDRNVLNPKGPTNRERLVDELNDLMGVVELATEAGILPANWQSESKKRAKKAKIRRFMRYALKVGTLQ